MKKLLVVIALFVGMPTLFAQDKKIEIETDVWGVGYFETLRLGENGFVLAYEKDKKTKITHYSNDATILWETLVNDEYSNKSFSPTLIKKFEHYDLSPSFLISTKSGAIVYRISLNAERFNNRPHYVTQISKSGIVKNITIEAQEQFGKSFQSAFCDESYLYYLATEQGDEMHLKKKREDKLILNRFDAKDFSYKKITLDLPLIEEGESTVFWSYIGQSSTEKFLVAKNINPENGKAILTIAAFNAEGKIMRTFSIDLKLDGAFLRPSREESHTAGFHQCAELNYSRPDRSEPSYGAYAHILFDENSESFFVYGLTGPGTLRRVGAAVLRGIYDGFYIQKFNSNGALLTKLHQKTSKEFNDDKYIRDLGAFNSRYLSLNIFPNDNMNLFISVGDKRIIFKHAFSKEGRLLREESGKNNDYRLLSVDSKLKSDDYLKGFDEKTKGKYSYENILSSKGEIMIEGLFNKNIISILYFKP